MSKNFLYVLKTGFHLQDEVEIWKRPEDFNRAALETKHLIDVADSNKVLLAGFSFVLYISAKTKVNNNQMQYSVPLIAEINMISSGSGYERVRNFFNSNLRPVMIWI